MTLTLIISMFPDQDLALMGRADLLYQASRSQLNGKFKDGKPFKIVRPVDVPTLAASGHMLNGILLRAVKVVSPAAISQEQKEWLLTRQRAIIKGEFISVYRSANLIQS